MPLEKHNGSSDRWAPLSEFVAEQHLTPDDLVRLADAKRLPPHIWIGDACLVDRRRLFSWRQLVKLEGLLPQRTAGEQVV